MPKTTASDVLLIESHGLIGKNSMMVQVETKGEEYVTTSKSRQNGWSVVHFTVIE